MSAANNVDQLRTHLFETLTALRDKNDPMDIDRAKAVAEVAQTIINSAKVEVDAAKILGARTDSGFLQLASAGPAPNTTTTPTGAATTVGVPGGRVTTHRIS